MTEELSASKRSGFWRHAFALAIDTLIVSVVVMVIGTALSALTDGRVRVGDAFINKTECFNLDRSYPEIRLPDDFKPTGAGRCVRSILGHSYDWFLVVEQKTVSGAVTYKKSRSFPLDRSGNVTRAYYLDGISPVLIVILIFMQEAIRGDTSGKRTMRLRVQSLAGGTASRKQIAVRLLRFAALIPIEAAVLIPTLYVIDASYIFGAIGLSGLLMIAIVGEFIWAINRGELPFYDRWAGTEVVRADNIALIEPSSDPSSSVLST